MHPPLALAAVDAVQIRLVMDNAIDLLMAGSEVAHRLPLGPNPFERSLPLAEHGFSALIVVTQGHKTCTVLFDTGISRTGILYNLDAMEINALDIQAIRPRYVMPGHCTGWVATHQIARALPQTFIANSVGTALLL